MRLFIGVHHNPPDGPGPVGILLGTQALFNNYVMGPKHPATHAYVVIELEGFHWVLDGKPSRAEWTPVVREGRSISSGAFKNERPAQQALWEVVGNGTRIDIYRAITRALSLTRAAYDWSEIAAASVAAFSVLPGLHKLRMFGRKDAFDDAFICTHVCTHVLEAVSAEAVRMVQGMRTRFPEELAQRLEAESKKDRSVRWVSPVQS